jgi:hypothetical protein
MILISTILSVVIFAQDGVIKFAKGKTSATVAGKINKGEEKAFTFNAKEGQTVKLKVTSGNKKVSLSGYGEGGDESLVTTIDATTDAGENTFTVTNRGNSTTNFTLTVTVK